MATKKTQTIDYSNAPETLDDHPFFGIRIDDPEQQAFRDSIWDSKCDIVFCNAKAGTGKTTIAVATAFLMVQYHLYDEVVYLTAAGVHEYKQGALPGTIEQKSAILMQPLYQAVANLGYDPESIVKSDGNALYQKDGTACITAMTNSYIRGINIGSSTHKVVYIIEEAQNFSVDELRTALSRVNEGSKTIVIGHDKQCDLKYKQESGFVAFMNHFKDRDWCKVCTLTKNYRGRVSSWADQL